MSGDMSVILAALAFWGVAATAPAPEWQPLFDGRTLAGWHVEALPRDRGKEFWQVRAGAVTCDSLGQPDHDYVWLVSDGEYGDFELRLQVRGFPRSHGNSGIQFRSRYDETREARRWIFSSLPDWRIEAGQGPREWAWRQAGEGTGWNDLRLAAVGMHVTTTVNGITIADFDGTGVLDDDAHRRHEVGRRGHFAFQLHKDDELLIQFRDIRVRVLD